VPDNPLDELEARRRRKAAEAGKLILAGGFDGLRTSTTVGVPSLLTSGEILQRNQHFVQPCSYLRIEVQFQDGR
jgi:hypothetical protein